ncbi:MAG: hypothetical protein PVF14_07240 [Desulfobacterales bacterium]|jgi:hypothetical protein
MRRRYFTLVAILACAVLLSGNDVILAREDEEPRRLESAEKQPPSSDEQEAIKGYPVRKRYVGGPTDVEWDLDNSFPKRGSVLELILRCQETHD